MSVIYTPPKSLIKFFTSEKFGSLVVGPIGSTKTTAGILRIAFKAKQMAPCRDGVRRSRCIWIRNTRQMLFDSSIPDFLKWFPDGQAGSFARTDGKFFMRFDDVECEVMFRGLDDANDVRRLLSLQASFAVMDEFREINKDIFEAVQGRLGRYPDGMMVPHRPEWGKDSKGNPIQGCVRDDGTPNKHIWGMTNPPDQDTFWEEFLTNPPDNFDVTLQPSGLSPEADWLHLLPTDYYENLMEGKNEDYIDVYIHAKFGKSLSGKPVFRAFSRDVHVAKDPLNPIPGTPLLIGVDAGLTPAAFIAQVSYSGQVVGHNALVSEGMGALRFIREKIKPLLANKFPNYLVSVVIDPAAFQRAQTDERTVADIFRAEGFRVVPAKTNTLTARLAAVDQYLTRTVDGKPGIVLDREGCLPLIQALAGRYRYKINTKDEASDTPEKSHPWSDIADACQYVCLHADGGSVYGALNDVQRREVKKVAYHWS